MLLCQLAHDHLVKKLCNFVTPRGCSAPECKNATLSVPLVHMSLNWHLDMRLQVWGWHLSPQAAAHPGAHGFGWFFRYLTFYSFSLQAATLALSALSDIVSVVSASSRLFKGTGPALSEKMYHHQGDQGGLTVN